MKIKKLKVGVAYTICRSHGQQEIDMGAYTYTGKDGSALLFANLSNLISIDVRDYGLFSVYSD
jgi:hypothetical protein